MPRADMASDCAGHDADRAGPGDQHILAHEVEGERGMDRVAERIEDRAEFIVDVVGQGHDVERGHPHEFGEGAGDVDADAARLGIEMIAPAARRPAPHADHVAFARHPLADLEPLDVGADGGDLARIFMPDRHRRRDRLPRPFVPVEDVDVGAADPGLVHFDQNIIRPDLGDRLIGEPQARLRLLLDEGAHGGSETIRRQAPASIQNAMRVSRSATAAPNTSRSSM